MSNFESKTLRRWFMRDFPLPWYLKQVYHFAAFREQLLASGGIYIAKDCVLWHQSSSSRSICNWHHITPRIQVFFAGWQQPWRTCPGNHGNVYGAKDSTSIMLLNVDLAMATGTWEATDKPWILELFNMNGAVGMTKVFPGWYKYIQKLVHDIQAPTRICKVSNTNLQFM